MQFSTGANRATFHPSSTAIRDDIPSRVLDCHERSYTRRSKTHPGWGGRARLRDVHAVRQHRTV